MWLASQHNSYITNVYFYFSSQWIPVGLSSESVLNSKWHAWFAKSLSGQAPEYLANDYCLVSDRTRRSTVS